MDPGSSTHSKRRRPSLRERFNRCRVGDRGADNPTSIRRGRGTAIPAACAPFVALCRRFNLFTQAAVAIDGSRFKAVNNRDKQFAVAKVANRIEGVEGSIARDLVPGTAPAGRAAQSCTPRNSTIWWRCPSRRSGPGVTAALRDHPA